MAEQLHQDLQAYTGIDQRCGVRVAKLMRRDNAQPGGFGHVGQLLAQGAPEIRRPDGSARTPQAGRSVDDEADAPASG